MMVVERVGSSWHWVLVWRWSPQNLPTYWLLNVSKQKKFKIIPRILAYPIVYMVGPFTKEDKNRGRTVLYQCCYGGDESIEKHKFCFVCVNLKPLLIDIKGDIRVRLALRVRSRLEI